MSYVKSPVRKKTANIHKHGRPRKHKRRRSGVREASTKAVNVRG